MENEIVFLDRERNLKHVKYTSLLHICHYYMTLFVSFIPLTLVKARICL